MADISRIVIKVSEGDLLSSLVQFFFFRETLYFVNLLAEGL